MASKTKKSSSSSGTSHSKSNSSSSSTPSTTKRLLQELSTSQKDITRNPNIERLEPVDEDNLYLWQAVINGRGLGGGYEDGRWLLEIRVPDGKSERRSDGKKSSKSGDGAAYPLVPPVVRFVTKIVAANVSFATGEICLDLLKTAWTPAYTLSSTIDAIHQMLGMPEVDSPLNVDVAALLRQGDAVGAAGLVKLYISDGERYEGR